MTEWMPRSPCANCTARDSDLNYCGNHCSLIRAYAAAVAAQKKLLEYLYEQLSDGNWISATAVSQMLKQQEGQNG